MPEKQTLEVKGVLVTCTKCGHKWDCTSTFRKVSCPSCNTKVIRIPEDEDGTDND